MKTTIFLTLLLALFTGCAPETHVNSLTGKSTTKNPAKPPKIPTDPTNPDGKLCQHPDAANYEEICSDDKGSCIFYACKDPKYKEYEKYLTFKRYIEAHGGEIYHDPSLCKTIKDPDPKVKCQHPDALNEGAEEFCKFEACPISGYTEYEKYLDYKDYVAQQGGGEVIGKAELCKTGTPGCMDPAATNFNPKANEENGSCNFDKCSLVGREKFDAAFKVIFDAYLAKLASLGKNYSGTANTDAICGQAIIEGCTDSKAFNFNKNANKDDKSCEFKACTKEGTPGFTKDKPIRDAQAAYKLLHPTAKDLTSDSTRCNGGPNPEGCTDPKASNYNPLATVDNKSCEFKACNTMGTEKYASDKPIRDAQTAYKQKNPTAKDLILGPCGGVFGCMDSKASNYSSNATVDDKTCEFKACNTVGTEKYASDKPIRDAQTAYKQKNPTAKDLILGPCGGLVGCMDSKASNFKPGATVDDKSCEFKACSTVGTENYTPHKPIRDAFETYKKKNPTAKDLIAAPCGGLLGCMDVKASNFNPSATVEDKSCEFKACKTVGMEFFIPHAPIRDAHAAYKAKYPTAKDLIAAPCGGLLGCMDLKASNYNKNAKTEDKSCEFKACNTVGTQFYTPHAPIRNAHAAYKLLYPDAKDLTLAPCGGVIGCMSAIATNFNPQASIESKSCNFSGCLDSTKQGYTSEYATAYAQYISSIGGQSKYLGVFTNTCGGPILNYHLEFGPLPTTAEANQNFDPQPKVYMKDQFGSVKTSDSSSQVTIDSYTDPNCNFPTSEQISVAQNPKAVSSGVVQYASVRYGQEGIIYLKASTPGLASICGGPINISPETYGCGNGFVDGDITAEYQSYNIWSRTWSRSGVYGMNPNQDAVNITGSPMNQIVQVTPNLLTIDCTTSACASYNHIYMQLNLKAFGSLPKNVSIITELSGANCTSNTSNSSHRVQLRSYTLADGYSDFEYYFLRSNNFNGIGDTTQIKRQSCSTNSGNSNDSKIYQVPNTFHLVNPTAVMISHEQSRPAISVAQPTLSSQAPADETVSPLDAATDVQTYLSFRVPKGCKATYQITVAP